MISFFVLVLIYNCVNSYNGKNKNICDGKLQVTFYKIEHKPLDIEGIASSCLNNHYNFDYCMQDISLLHISLPDKCETKCINDGERYKLPLNAYFGQSEVDYPDISFGYIFYQIEKWGMMHDYVSFKVVESTDVFVEVQNFSISSLSGSSSWEELAFNYVFGPKTSLDNNFFLLIEYQCGCYDNILSFAFSPYMFVVKFIKENVIYYSLGITCAITMVILGLLIILFLCTFTVFINSCKRFCFRKMDSGYNNDIELFIQEMLKLTNNTEEESNKKYIQLKILYGFVISLGFVVKNKVVSKKGIIFTVFSLAPNFLHILREIFPGDYDLGKTGLVFDYVVFSILLMVIFLICVDLVFTLLYIGKSIIDPFQTAVMLGNYKEYLVSRLINSSNYVIVICLVLSGYGYFIYALNLVKKSSFNINLTPLFNFEIGVSILLVFIDLYQTLSYDGASSFILAKKLRSLSFKQIFRFPKIYFNIGFIFSTPEECINNVLTSVALLRGYMSCDESKQLKDYGEEISLNPNLSHLNWNILRNKSMKKEDVIFLNDYFFDLKVMSDKIVDNCDIYLYNSPLSKRWWTNSCLLCLIWSKYVIKRKKDICNTNKIHTASCIPREPELINKELNDAEEKKEDEFVTNTNINTSSSTEKIMTEF